MCYAHSNAYAFRVVLFCKLQRRDEDVNKLNKNKQFSHFAWAPLTDPAMSSFPQILHLPYCSSKRMPGIEAGA